MILPMHGTTAFVEPRAAATCTDCGTAAAGNFCSTCGADLCAGSLGLFGFARRSFPAVYLQLLSAPIRATVALAEDRSYRTHLSFLLTSIAVFCLLMLPTLFEASGAAAPGAHVSESMQNLMRVLSQAGAYIGTAITFLIAFGLFRYFAREPRTLPAYFKLYCLAFGFVMPIYAAYEFVARHILGVTGMSSLGTVVQWTPSALLAGAFALVLWAYFIAIHQRFWRLPLWKAIVLYVVSATSSYQLSFWLMYGIGHVTAKALLAHGFVQT
jgi:hypothetical protein